MPPAKRPSKAAGKQKAAASSSTGDAATLLARIKRSDLEELVRRHLDDKQPITLGSLSALLPEEMRCAGLPQPKKHTVTPGEERTGTGRFDDISDECLQLILLHVPFSQRLTCAIQVCKAWRSLRQAAGLWTEVSVNPNRYPSAFGRLPEVAVNNEGLARLMDWLPSLEAVRSFDLDAGESIPPDAIKRVLTSLPGLTSLALQGKKVTAACLKVLPPRAAKLQELRLGEYAYHGEEVKMLLRATPQLEALTTPSGADLTMVANALRTARLGGDPLLHTLKIDGGYGSHAPGLSRTNLIELGKSLPELQELYIKDMATYGMSGDVSVAPMPRLLRLKIKRLCNFHNHLKTWELTSLLTSLLGACPNLEELELCHGVHHISGRERKEGKKQDPFPEASGCFLQLPSALRRFSLSDIQLAADDIDAAVLPRLEHVSLKNCGQHSQAIVNQLKAQSGRLQRDGAVTVSHAVGSYFGY